MDISDAQWNAIKDAFPAEEFRRPGPKGGRHWAHPRDVLDAVFWIMGTGAPWKDLPRHFPAYQTCHRRFTKWCKDKVLEAALQRTIKDLRERGKVDLTEGFIDGSNVGAKKGVLLLVGREGALRPRSWRLQTLGVFLSPQGLQAVKNARRDLRQKQLKRVSARQRRSSSSEIKPTIVTRSTKS